jgi:hypothetical protein
MKPFFLLPLVTLFSAFSAAAAPSPVASFAVCDDHSRAVVQSPLIKDLVPSSAAAKTHRPYAFRYVGMG